MKKSPKPSSRRAARNSELPRAALELTRGGGIIFNSTTYNGFMFNAIDTTYRTID